MDKQEIFDKGAKHLLTQNARAAAQTGQCKYRATTPNGDVLKCAVRAQSGAITFLTHVFEA